MQMPALHTEKILQQNKPRSPRVIAGFVFALLAGALSVSLSAQTSGAYKVTNLISDGSVNANFTDPSFLNPWAISVSPTWWISTANTGLSFVVAATPTPGTIRFKVNVPPASGATANGFPAGCVTTAGSAATAFMLPNGTQAAFLFSTLDGTISGWNNKLGAGGSTAQIVINKGPAAASYTGLALLNTSTASYLLAANFGAGNAIEVYDSNFQPTKLAGSFTDPNLPAGYAPFSVHILNNQIYVAYALRSATAPVSVDAVGNGAVSVFDTSGNFVSRIATGGNLNSPWGVALAPANFGVFGGSLLIGNFGDGFIYAYDPASAAYRGRLTDGTGKPLSYASLWELLPGGTAVGNSTTVSGGDTNTVYFTAGLAKQQHGLFGAIANDTSAGTPAFGMSAGAGALTVPAGEATQATISIAPTYGFNGVVSLSCSGFPAGASCNFAPAQVTATPTAPAYSTLTIQTSPKMALLTHHSGAGIAFAFLLPFASLAVFYRRRSVGNAFRLMVVCGIMTAVAGTLAACSNNRPTTPAGTNPITITASSGSVSQTTTIALTVQ
jgi:uncharacterized protein (TIGR03118 family)